MLFSVEYRLFYRAFNKATAHGRVGFFNSDLLLGFYKSTYVHIYIYIYIYMCKPLLVETYFCNIFLECGYNYQRLQYISASDLDLIFSKREHLGLKSEFREKLQKWKRSQVSLIFNIFITGCNNFKF